MCNVEQGLSEGIKKCIVCSVVASRACADCLPASTSSARSTDSELRRWDYGLTRTTKVYHGHVNEKNFVGLSAHASGDYIACGEVWAGWGVGGVRWGEVWAG